MPRTYIRNWFNIVVFCFSSKYANQSFIKSEGDFVWALGTNFLSDEYCSFLSRITHMI